MNILTWDEIPLDIRNEAHLVCQASDIDSLSKCIPIVATAILRERTRNASTSRRPKCGDPVLHRSSGRTGWIVAINDDGYILNNSSLRVIPLSELEPM